MKRLAFAFLLGLTFAAPACFAKDDDDDAKALPTGQLLTPLAATGAKAMPLKPGLPAHPDFAVDHAISLALSPDRKTALVLTSGFNRLAGPDGKPAEDAASEYVLVFDLSGGAPRQTQALSVANSFAGIAFAPDGEHFYVGGGSDDRLLAFAPKDGQWSADGAPISLGHDHGLGLDPKLKPETAGVAVSADGKLAVVANYNNDSLSVVDLAARSVADIDLRPGKARSGGTYPFWVALKKDGTAYVSSLRDREVVVVDLLARTIKERIALSGNPNRMVLDKAQRRLFVAADNSDEISQIDTATNRMIGRVKTTAPAGLLAEKEDYRGAAPNALFLSEDETRLYVTNGGANDVAVMALAGNKMTVAGLIPTGWYPSDVAIANGVMMVLDGKSVAGPNPHWCSGSTQDAAKRVACRAANNYVEQLEKADLLTLPVPTDADLESLTRQVAANNRYQIKPVAADRALMAALRQRIKHVIYVIKENRTYDQVLGDLGKGNGDASLTEFGRALTPNHHALAEDFVTLDNFYDSGEVSGDGWAWSTASRETDILVKQTPVNYAMRGLSYDSEGENRDINVSLGTAAERRAANPDSPDDPDILPGTHDAAAPDPAQGPAQHGYLWDAALKAKLSVRNYGFFLDLHRYGDTANPILLERDPFTRKVTVAYATNRTLAPLTDPYFRGFDNKLADFWREKEWEREFDLYAAKGTLPSLSLVRLMHDHFGEFGKALDKVDVPERQIGDNDYALGRLVEKVATSRFAGDTLIFVVEDDAQDGPDHVDAHRSIAFVVGPYVKQKAVVSRHLTTVNMLRTIEDVLGIDHLSLNDAYQRPMSEIFDLNQKDWTYHALVPETLYGTDLPLPRRAGVIAPAPTHEAAWWQERTKDMDFSQEDKIDPARFNQILWEGLMTAQARP